MAPAPSNASFTIRQHCIEGQYMREYPQGLVDQSVVPKIQIKQYVPTGNLQPDIGDATVIFAGGIGFIKELYEPLFEDLVAEFASRGVSIRSIWVADMYVFGASAQENSKIRGNDPSWWDHSRDLLAMINHFWRDMPQPLVGIGHSMGAAQIGYLSTLHPRLFQTLVLIEPQIHDGVPRDQVAFSIRLLARRRETWATRSAAEKAIHKNPFYKTWDPRAINRLIEYSLQEVSSAADTNSSAPIPSSTSGSQQDPKDRPTQTTTSRDVEVGLYGRPNLSRVGTSSSMSADVETASRARDRVPDVDPKALETYPLYRPEPTAMFRLLPHVRPPVLFICSAGSLSSAPRIREAWRQDTGTGVGGNGGVAARNVVVDVLDGESHTIAMDGNINKVVTSAGRWCESQLQAWTRKERAFREGWQSKPLHEKQSLDPVIREMAANYTGEQDLEAFVKKLQSKL